MKEITQPGKPARWKIILAFATIYLVWGSTFLAIRVGVREVPPFLYAAIRFTIAGLAIYLFLIARGEKSPTARQWRAAAMLGAVIFVLDYGLLFWTERRIPSGIAAVMLATIPAWIALAEILFLRTLRMTAALGVALAMGVCGVAVLMSRSLALGGAPVDRRGAVALIIASVSWSVASVVTRKMPLPESKVMSSGAQMLAGGLLLFVTSFALGEFRGFEFASVSRGAWWALAYLIVAGSIIAFTAYTWLIHHESPTKVGTYAYVNPVVAVALGYFLGGEPLDARTMIGSACVLVSVVVITLGKSETKASAAVETIRVKALDPRMNTDKNQGMKD